MANATPISTLCTQCTNLKLTATDFYLKPDEAKKLNETNVFDPIKIDTRSWQDIERANSCSLCQMIKVAVESSRFEWQHSESPHTCNISTRRLHGHDNKTCDYDVRYLEIEAHYNWTFSNDIALLPAESEKYPGCFPGRIVEPKRLDMHRIKAWMDKCQSMHGDRCRHVESPQFQGIRQYVFVIDVENLCLVSLPPSARYVALSYVWGNVEQPSTRKENLESFKKHKGLNLIYSQLPNVILDALSFLKSFGERYLWVDTLCIIQDDEDFKKVLIDSMHVVYENAYLTLFATTGTNSNAGLPGVQPDSRGVSQMVATITDGLTLVFPINYGRIRQSKWATRGWTYQEYFFAKRRLLFVEGQAVYQCNTARWREDIAQEHLERRIVHYQVDYAGSRMNWEPPQSQFSEANPYQWSRSQYNTYLETYLDRNLTFDNDILRAFTGIIHEAESKKLKCCWGMTEKHIGRDMLWLPSKWLVRRPGFPSWSWAGWKGPVIPGSTGGPYSDTIWRHRKSWIDWYLFRKSSGKFDLLSSGYAPHQETAIASEEEKERARDERIAGMRKQETNGEDHDNNDSQPHVSSDNGSLSSLLWRLCQSNSVQPPSERESPYPLYCTPSINEQTLLFRTLTAYVSISTLNPSGNTSLPPRDDQLLLPAAPTLHLYASDGTHIGSAWPHSQECFNEVATFDQRSISDGENASRLQIEIAIIAGPFQGDWRTRIEKPTTWEYMLELAGSGLHLGMLQARYKRRLAYEQAIGNLYIAMVHERQVENISGVEERLTTTFWDEMRMRIALMNLKATFPGHCDEMMETVIDGLTTSGSGMRSKKGQKFLKVMLIGNLGDGETNGSGGIKERVGMGEIRDDAMGLIQKLAIRDVMLK